MSVGLVSLNQMILTRASSNIGHPSTNRNVHRLMSGDDELWPRSQDTEYVPLIADPTLSSHR